jgi:hypothetical protein
VKKTTGKKAVAAPAKPAIEITGCDEADRFGLDLGSARLEREALQLDINQQKTAIDQRYAKRLEELATTENTLQLALDTFAAKHGQPEDLNYIEIVGTGGGLAVAFDVDEEDVIKRLKRSDVWKSLVKVTEHVSKRDLPKIPTKLHERFGFTYGATKVSYSVKPKLDAVRIYAERRRTNKKR